MGTVITTTIVITLVGLIVGIALVYTGKKFHVEIDPRESAVRECLPGNNCGACGYAGCDAMAAAIAKGEAAVNGCPVGGQAAADKIAEVMGVTAEAQERKVAFVRCKGNCEVTSNQANYIGVKDCRSAVLCGIVVPECEYGCLGFGSCAAVCPNDAIVVKDGVAFVNRSKCVGCGLCAKACPKGLIDIIPASSYVAVQCSNKDRGPQVKKVCSAGCIGCMLCTRQCESDAIHVDANLAHIDYAKCTQCGKCAAKCPVKVILPPVGSAVETAATKEA